MSRTLEELRREQIEEIQRRKRQKRSIRTAPALFILFLLTLLIIIFYNILVVNRTIGISFYTCPSPKIIAPVCLVQLSDLHSRQFGSGNQRLIENIKEIGPDLILITGDMVNSTDTDVSAAVNLCGDLTEIAPVYYQYGNHESILMRYGKDGIKVPIDAYLEKKGVHFFYNDFVDIQVNGNELALMGISVSEENYERWAAVSVEQFQKRETYKILLSHYPSLYYSTLSEADIDLALAGHYHGGLIRIPGIGGLYHPDDGLFPKYSGGKYRLKKGTLIVSRGLGNHGWIPRINNQPELTVIELVPENEQEEG